jgi:hypothetical protein
MPDLMTEEFDDIIRALEAERPQIDPGFARELDARAAAGFAKPRRRWRVALPYIAVPATGLAALAFAVAGLSGGDESGGTLSSGGDGGGSTAASAPAPKAVQESAPPASADDSAAGAALPSRASGSFARGRVQEQSAALTLVAPGKEVAGVGDRIIGVADQVGGFVVSSNVRATDGAGGGGDFILRVPVQRLDDALARLSRLAHVAERTQGSQDITAERNMARERLQEAAAERKSLLLRLAEADTTAEVESLKAQLRDVSNAIASYRDSLARVVRRARFAQVSVTLTAKPKDQVVGPEDDGKWTPADAIRDAGRFLEVAAGVVLLVGSVLLPVALLALLALGAQRLAGRRGRDRVLDAV